MDTESMCDIYVDRNAQLGSYLRAANVRVGSRLESTPINNYHDHICGYYGCKEVSYRALRCIEHVLRMLGVKV